MHLFVFFFFQAEDGIRDTSVTGVQTCALPISGRGTDQCTRSAAARRTRRLHGARRHRKIGRASCREECRSRGGPDHEKKKKKEKRHKKKKKRNTSVRKD